MVDYLLKHGRGLGQCTVGEKKRRDEENEDNLRSQKGFEFRIIDNKFVIEQGKVENFPTALVRLDLDFRGGE